MRRPPRANHRNAPTTIAIVTLSAGIQMWCVANAQNTLSGIGPSFGSTFTSRLADSIPVSGFTGSPLAGSEFVLGPDQELGQGFKGASCMVRGSRLSIIRTFPCPRTIPTPSWSPACLGLSVISATRRVEHLFRSPQTTIQSPYSTWKMRKTTGSTSPEMSR